VVHRAGVHRFDEAEVIGDRGDFGQEAANPSAALAVLAKFGDLGEGRFFLLPTRHGAEAFVPQDFGRQLLTLPLAKHRFVIVEVDVGRCPVL
jgi:hypothetical protein